MLRSWDEFLLCGRYRSNLIIMLFIVEGTLKFASNFNSIPIVFFVLH